MALERADLPTTTSAGQPAAQAAPRRLFERAPFVLRGFACTTDALASSAACRDAGLACRLVPRPATMGNVECGTALRTFPADEGPVRGALAAAGVVPVARIEVEDYV